MSTWEYIVSGTAEKTIDEKTTVLREKPKQSYSLKANLMDKTDLDAEIARVMGDNATAYTYTLADSTTVTGIPRNIAYELQAGTLYYNVTLGIQKALAAGDVKWGWVVSGSITRPDVKAKSTTATDNADETITVTAKNAPYSQATTQAAAARGGIATGTYTLLSGNGTVTGTIKSVTYQEVDGTALCDVTVTLQVVPTTSIVWKWVPSYSCSKKLIIAKSISEAVAARKYSYEGPDEQYVITTKNAPFSQIAVEAAKVKALGTSTSTYTMDDGSTAVGIPISIASSEAEGEGLYNITLTLQV